MSFIHSREYLTVDSVVSVQCTHEIKVLLLDDNNYSGYRCGTPFTYYGGFYRHFPADIAVPHTGNWNIVLALTEGNIGSIRYSIHILPA